MLLKSRLVSLGSCIGLGFLLVSCYIEDPRPDERETVTLESWESTPAASSYSYLECKAGTNSSYLLSFCGQKPGNALTGDAGSPYTYNWGTNCRGSECAQVSVMAFYQLNTDMGAGQTLRIEAFDNAQFRGSPVANLEIVGFDTSHPNSTKPEKLFLAPGEYYFRAYITHDGDRPLPYTFDGMELVDERPVGVYGALSGAERVVIRSTGDFEVINIVIDQLFQKTNSAEDTLAKLRLQIAIDSSVAIPTYRNVHIVLTKEADVEATPAYDFTLSTNQFLIKDQENQADFLSPSLTPGDYYVFSYIDTNGNGFADLDEAAAFVLDDGEPMTVKVEKNRTRSAKVLLLQTPAVEK